ncbi:MAG: hypothetical protein CMB49_07690 [Euryarchaeota archaeon]|nr:hypothetical protein [Euryarchaeota archaeon]MBK30566.1 hypothetical protein [Euryarchaeota archaeon]
MVERFLPSDDPVLEEVLVWTINRDSLDMRRLLEWIPQARSIRERKLLLEKVRALADELEGAMQSLSSLQSGE